MFCSVPAADEELLAKFQITKDSAGDTANGADAGIYLRTVLAAGLLLGTSGGLVLRTTTPEAPDRVHGWRLSHGELHPLTEAQVFNACVDHRTGQPIDPEPDVEYRAGFPLALAVPDTNGPLRPTAGPRPPSQRSGPTPACRTLPDRPGHCALAWDRQWGADGDNDDEPEEP